MIWNFQVFRTERERNTFQNKNKVVWLQYLFAEHEKKSGRQIPAKNIVE